MARIKVKLTPADCDMCRHGLLKFQEAIELWQRCAVKDPEVKALVDSAQEAFQTLAHYLCEFGDGKPEEYQ